MSRTLPKKYMHINIDLKIIIKNVEGTMTFKKNMFHNIFFWQTFDDMMIKIFNAINFYFERFIAKS